MRARRPLAPWLAAIAAAVAFSVIPRADEGFWPYNSVPKAAIKATYGFTVTDAWLGHLQLATVRVPGGTGSIVSPNGLVLTNHHLVLSSLQRLSTPEKDLVKNGFVAMSYGDELKVPGTTISVLQRIEDVTARVASEAKPGMAPQEANAARQKAIQAVQGEPQAGVTRQVVSLYAGAIYHLYTYKVYSDVRLVFGAEYQAGFFGGDPDNFTYPRYNLDLGLFRLYENDKPAATPNYLKWSPKGSRENELVFTTGYPGATQRLNTLAHVQYRRDVALPFAIASNEMRESAVQKWAALSPENARQTVQELFRIQNSLKSQRGQLKGLQSPALLAQKETSEKRLRSELAKNAAKQQELGDAWDIIEKSLGVARRLDAERNFIANAAGLNSTLFTAARNLVRTADNPPSATGRGQPGRAGRGSAPGGPPPGGQPGGRGARGAGGASGAPPLVVDIPREKINLTESLAFMQRYLGPTHAIVQRILGDKTPEARATELIDRCRLLDTEIYALLLAGGRAAIDVSTDPMIVLARSLEADAQAVTKRYDAEVTAVQDVAYPKVGQAVFAVDGARAYPDATSTLRLSYGAVKRYVEDGKRIQPYTDFAGLYQRSAAHNNQPPYDLAPRWIDNRGAINLKTPFNFVSTNDIVGGNSGSAVVNRKGEVVGLVFDGNIQSLPGYFFYEEAVNRAVSVDSRAIMEALRGIYKATWLVEEITGQKTGQPR